MGTPFRECLGSYYMRLADVHSLHPTDLAWGAVFPEHAHARRTFDECWRRSYFNGIGDPTQEWVQRLEGLTMAKGLGTLTLGFLRGRASMRGLLCQKNRWCAACLKEDAENGTPYGRLLWAFQAVTCCPIHRTRLVERCDCGADDARGARLPKCLPNICVKCSCDLADTQDLDPEVPTLQELRHAKLVSELLMSEVALGGELAGRDLSHFLGDSVTKYAEGNAEWFARMLGVGKSTLFGWTRGLHFPDFAHIITIAESHGCSISDVLCGRSEVVTRNPMDSWSNPAGRITKAARKPQQKIDWDAVGKRLEEFLQADEPLTLIEVGKSLGISPEALRENRLPLCMAISARWKGWNTAAARGRDQELEDRVREVARGLAQRGTPPTWRRVVREGFSSTPSWRGTRRLYEICREVWAESSPEQGGGPWPDVRV
jgi:hypothetical protein